MQWKLDPTLLGMLQALDAHAAGAFREASVRWPGIYIISGHRQSGTRLAGTLNSLHERCPSLAADLRVGTVPSSLVGDSVWNWLGARWALMGGRWGGRFGVRDENHFDLGVGFPPTPG